MKFIFNWIAPALCVAASWCAAVAPADATAPERIVCETQARDPGARGVVERAELVMGSVARIALPAFAATPAAFEAGFAALRAVDAAMSLYRSDSELVRVNAHAARHPEPVDVTLFALLIRARELSAESDGAFDVTVLPLLRLWGAYPALAYLGEGSRTAVGYEGLRLDPEHRTVSFARPGMGLDLGGIAKGFALDRARAALAAAAIASARVDLGGDVAFVGGDTPWRVAVRDPASPGHSLGILELAAGASVSTSGNYARDFAAEGWRTRSHVYDPRTGKPVAGGLAVSVWTADATTGDALSTALLVLGPEGAAPLLAREPAAGALFVDDRGGARRLVLAGRPPLAFTPADERTAVASIADDERPFQER